MNAQARQPPSALWRVLTRPIGPRILPQIDFGPAPRAVIAAANLPDPISDLVGRVVRRTRLWRSERAEVARELCSHFAEGLAAGRSPQELVEAFGDPRSVAAMIRQAKRRSRHPVWRAMRRLQQALLAATLILVVLYAWLSLRFYTARPVITHNYSADLNAGALAVPESERAWPLYRQAALARTPTPRSLQFSWGPMTPDDPRWADMVQHLADNRERLALIHKAASRPHLGHILTDANDPEIWAAYEIKMIPVRATENPELGMLDGNFRQQLLNSVNLLVREASAAAVANQPSQVLLDIRDMLAVATHLASDQTVPAQMASLAALGQALDTTAMMIERYPALFSPDDLKSLAHVLASHRGGGAIRLSFDDERAFVKDLAQRLYSPDGRFTPAGKRLLRYRTGDRALASLADQGLAFVVNAAIVLPSRGEFVAAYDRALEIARAESVEPLYRRPGHRLRDPIFPPPLSYYFFARPTAYSAEFFLAAAVSANLAAEQATQRRDALLAVMAVEVFKRRHGRYPESLDQLVPSLLPAVPLDRYDGAMLKYMLRDGVPVLYVAGVDRDDDGGKAPAGPDPRPISDWLDPASLAQAAASKLGTNYDGDWILWPLAPRPDPAP